MTQWQAVPVASDRHRPPAAYQGHSTVTATHALSRFPAPPQSAVGTDLAAQVQAAIDRLEADPDDAVVAEQLAAEHGFTRSAAERLVFLVPIAFARAEALRLRLAFPRHYVLVNPRVGRRTLIPFLAEPTFREAARAASHRLRLQGRDAGFVAVAGRSPEYRAVQSALLSPDLAGAVALPESVAHGEDDFSTAPAGERRAVEAVAEAPRRRWPAWLGGGR